MKPRVKKLPALQQMSLELEEFLICPRFENFVFGANHEVLSCLQNLPKKLAQAKSSLEKTHVNQWVYIWGDSASGKTHVLQALNHIAEQHQMPTIYLSAKDSENAFILYPQPCIYCIDDVDYFNTAQQIALFNLINETRIYPLNAIVSCGKLPPIKQMHLREDLRTRLGWGLVYQLKQLSSEQQLQALEIYKQEKNFVLDVKLLPWLQKNLPADLAILKDVLNLLDAYSLAQKKPMTISLLKKMFAELEFTAPNKLNMNFNINTNSTQFVEDSAENSAEKFVEN